MPHYRAELHVHTVLSACAGIEMIPPIIIETVQKLGINLIAITDHNSGANAKSVMDAAKGTGVSVLPGMELETAEEVHALCLFDTLEQLQCLQNIVDTHLPPMQNNEDFFGSQLIVDKHGNFLVKEDRMLLTSTSISIQKACELVTEMGGLFIPAHVNREANGLFSHLGTIPPDLSTDIFEISRHITRETAFARYPELKNFHVIQNGDVHYLDGFLGAVELDLQTFSVKAIADYIAQNF